jgi:hypothetical protein
MNRDRQLARRVQLTPSQLFSRGRRDRKLGRGAKSIAQTAATYGGRLGDHQPIEAFRSLTIQVVHFRVVRLDDEADLVPPTVTWANDEIQRTKGPKATGPQPKTQNSELRTSIP